MSKCIEKHMSASLEDYIMAIYEIIREKKGVRAVDISKRIGVGKSSVTDALKNLSDKKLINYSPYDVISLTDEGEKIAAEIAEKHTILQDFFQNVLILPPEEAAKNACRMSHAISKDAFGKFVQFISSVEKK